MKIEKNPGAVAAILLPRVPAAMAGSEPAWQTRDTINGKIYFSLTFWVKTHKLFHRLGSHARSLWQTGPPAVRLSRVTPMSVTAPGTGCQVPGGKLPWGAGSQHTMVLSLSLLIAFVHVLLVLPRP